MTVTIYMGIIKPDNSTSTSFGTAAQGWANMINAGFRKISSHDHTPGRGKQISSEDLAYSYIDMQGHSLTVSTDVNFKPQDSIDGIAPRSVYVNGVDLYYRNSDVVDVRITEDGLLVSGGVGGFYGDYRLDGSVATFSGEGLQYTFYGPSSTLADINCGPVTADVYVGDYTNNYAEQSYFDSITYKARNITAYAETGGMIPAYSKIESGDTIEYPYAVYTDKFGGVSESDRGNYGTTILGHPRYSPTFFGDVTEGYGRIGQHDTIQKNMKIVCTFDYYNTVVLNGELHYSWSNANPSIITTQFNISETNRTEDEQGTCVIISRKLVFYPNTTDGVPTLRTPSYTWKVTNFGAYKINNLTLFNNPFSTAATDFLGFDFSVAVQTIKAIYNGN